MKFNLKHLFDKLCEWTVYLGAACVFGYILWVMLVALANTACNGCVVSWYRAKVEAERKANYIPPPIEEEVDAWEDDEDWEDSSFD